MNKEAVHQSIQALFSTDKATVIEAINRLREEPMGSHAEDDLLGVLEDWMEIDWSVSLWCSIVLGDMGSEKAVESLLDMLDSDGELEQEAAAEALAKIAAQRGEKLLPILQRFIEDRNQHDPFDARLFAYEAVAALAPSEAALRFLVRRLDEDEEWRVSIILDLLPFKDPRLLSVLRRYIALAEETHDRDAYEYRAVYVELEGANIPGTPPDHPLWKEPWEKRWARPLEELGKTDEEIDAGEEKRFRVDFSKEKEEQMRREAQEYHAFLCAYPLKPFELRQYLEVRGVSVWEQQFLDKLRLIGFHDGTSLGEWQLKLNAFERPIDLYEMLKKDHTFPSEEANLWLMKAVAELWNRTPREEFAGLTPLEKSRVPRLREENDKKERALRDSLDLEEDKEN